MDGNKQLTIFSHEEFGQIRTTKEDGQIWFFAQDVCDALDLKNVTKVLESLDADERGYITISKVISESKRGTNKRAVVNEPGLYSLILRSRKPEAKKFKRWVTHEVLPAIREDGAYIASNGKESDEELLMRAVRAAERMIQKRERVIQEQREALEDQRPKVLFANAVATSTSSILVGELAKLLRQNGVNIGQNRLFNLLRDQGFLMKQGTSRNMPTQRAMEMGLFEIKETSIAHSDGHITIQKTPKVTGKGQIYFINRFASLELQSV